MRTLAACTLATLLFAAHPALALQPGSDGVCFTTVDDSLARLLSAFPVSSGWSAGSPERTTGPSAESRRRNPMTELVQQLTPSVVAIAARHHVPQGQSFFDPQTREPSKSDLGTGMGSGVIVHPAGIIVTNHHVIDGANEIRVLLANGEEVEAKLMADAPDDDLAFLYVPTRQPLPAVRLSTTDPILGETVVAIGTPLGLTHTVTMGVISATNRPVHLEEKGPPKNFIQLDASINPGNSGGGLFNVDAELTGINTLKFAAEGVEGIAFAIPAARVRPILEQVLRRISRGLQGRGLASWN